jgi:hypothetical protein
MTESTPESPEKVPDKKSGLTKYFSPIEIFAYVLAGVATIATTVSSISTQFFKNLKEHHLYPQIWQLRDEEYQNLQYGTSVNLGEKKGDIEKKFNDAINIQLKTRFGIPEAKGPISFVKRTWEQYKALKMHEQIDILIRLGLVAALAAGSLIFIFRSRYATEKKIESVKKAVHQIRKDETEEQPPAPAAGDTPKPALAQKPPASSAVTRVTDGREQQQATGRA